MTTITLGGNPIEVKGKFPQIGESVTDFSLTANDLSEVALSSYAGKRKILNIFPSIDTGVCDVRQKIQSTSLCAKQRCCIMHFC